MRLGLFGGSFDPVHHGHLRLAAACRDAARLDEVWFVPSAVQPHKPGGPVASDADRVAMLRFALATQTGMAVSLVEVDRGGVSYTVDTLRELLADLPDDDLFYLMGADTLADLPNWREPTEVLRLATPLVVHRAGEPAPEFGALATLVDAERLAAIRTARVEMPPVEISSSDLRRRAAAGESLAGLTPERVARYIEDRGLYR